MSSPLDFIGVDVVAGTTFSVSELEASTFWCLADFCSRC